MCSWAGTWSSGLRLGAPMEVWGTATSNRCIGSESRSCRYCCSKKARGMGIRTEELQLPSCACSPAWPVPRPQHCRWAQQVNSPRTSRSALGSGAPVGVSKLPHGFPRAECSPWLSALFLPFASSSCTITLICTAGDHCEKFTFHGR